MKRTLGLVAGVAVLAFAPTSFAADPTPAPICQAKSAPAGVPATAAAWAEGARLFDGLGSFHRAATTASPEAQRYFDQGMRFLWAFNHDESTRSFAKAAAIDPNCAICWWGLALTVGPNYNQPELAEIRAKVAREALDRATLVSKASPVERALIAALAKRYGPNGADPAAYAEAMKATAAAFPDDLDVATLTAEAMMNTNAWKLWALDGTPAPGTPEIVERLEKVLAKDPNHPGANHYYIHAVEASPHPEKGVAAAERLTGMMPAAGHMEHMPAHIMQRVGRYEEAAEANRKGAAADLAYFALTNPPDYYAMYTAHNYAFLAYSAAMEGRREEAMEAARKLRATVPDDMLAGMPGADWSVGVLDAVLVRFGAWDAILAEPAPADKFPGLVDRWHWATAIALAAKGRPAEAAPHLQAMAAYAASLKSDATFGFNSATDVLALETSTVRARVALAEGKAPEAATILTEAVAREDKLAYDEPADWFLPTRHLLGKVLLDAGKPKEAETVYRADLDRNPNNGWALYGLYKTMEAQHRVDETLRAVQRFGNVWTHADVTLAASAY